MARRPRIHVQGGLYHVTLRGNHRQSIFATDTDRRAFESFLAHAQPRFEVRLHAYCWMTNHIHLLAEVGEPPLGRLMQNVASRYARFVQRRAGTTGHLFERRYHAVLVDSERYLVELLRYIHLNPVRGGLVAHPDDYAWSSHRCYLGLAARPWLTTDVALSRLAGNPVDARKTYAELIGSALQAGMTSPLATPREDVRVLGTVPAGRGTPAGTSTPRTATTLEKLIDAACRESGLSLVELASPSRARRVNRVRILILERALAGRVATCSDVARRFGRSAAALSQAASRARRSPGPPSKR
jgi:putative transposase